MLDTVTRTPDHGYVWRATGTPLTFDECQTLGLDGTGRDQALSRPIGPCWDGHSFTGTARDACRVPAVATVPRDVWAPGSTSADYPSHVPACATHADDVWRAADEAAGHAEARATSADHLT